MTRPGREANSLSDNWVVQNIENALDTWNDKLSEIWSLVTQSPQTFKGGAIWSVIVNVNGALQAIGYGLLVLFFAVGVVKTCGSFAELKKPEHAVKLFVRFAIAKCLITYGMELMMLNTDDDILICDPEGEYAPLVEAMGDIGTVIRVAAGGRDRLNAMYMVDGYGENNPIVVKSQFIMSLVERIDQNGVGPQQKSIIDRCTAAVYNEAAETGIVPTLSSLREKLLEQPEEKAKDIALALELFTTGSLDIFGHKSTVDLDKRVVVFDIHGLGEQLKPIGHLVITDTMLNRVTLNWKRGKRTHIFIDEFHVMFENEFSAAFFNSAWRQFRKRNAFPTAITQNVEYLLDSVQASTMLSNSEFIVMLNQAASDRDKLAKLLNISNEQMSYITNADAGCGLIKYGSALVPFVNRFPKNTKLYRLMSTRPGEGSFSEGQA